MIGNRKSESRWDAAYRGKRRGAEAGASVEPVIVTKLVDLDTLLVRRRMRHRLCHHQRLGIALRGDAVICCQFRRKFEMLLERQLGGFVVTQDREGRQVSSGLRP